jgi:hypothetical protein
MDHGPQLSSRLDTIKELYKPTHVDDKVGSSVWQKKRSRFVSGLKPKDTS